jgi:capsid protein
MGFLDNLKLLFKRQAAPLAPAKAWYSTDGYEAATYTRNRSYIQTPGTEAMVNPSEFTRSEITRMSRFLINNYPLAERIASICEIYGVGAGISANAATTDPLFNNLATDAFSNWAGNVFATGDNEMNFYEAQKVIARELLICAELFIVLIKTAKGYPQITLVNSENVKHSGDASDDSVDGIFFDAYGKAIAYNVFLGNRFQKISADNVIHLKRVKNIGQKRGVGMFASSLNCMRDHKDMQLLIKKGLRAQLNQAVVVTKKVADAESGIASGLIPVDLNNFPTTQPTNTGLERALGGTVNYMQEGEAVQLLASEHPTENVLAFLESVMKDVCLSISLPYGFVVNPDSLNGTGIRFAISDASAFFGTLQTIIIDGALNRIYSWVIASFIKNGTLPAPANSALPWEVTFRGPCSVTVDQGRMSNSEIALLQAGLLNRENYWSARGKDWKKEEDQLIKEVKYIIEQAAANGIPLPILLPLKPGTAPADTQADTQLPDKTEAA